MASLPRYHCLHNTAGWHDIYSPAFLFQKEMQIIMEKFPCGEADLFSSRIIARPMHLQELDSYCLHFSRLYASFRGNAEADLFTVKDHFSTFLSSILVYCFSASFRKAFFFCQQMPHFAKTFEISPLILKFRVSWVSALKTLSYLCRK